MTGALEFPNSDLFSKDKEKLSLQNTCLCLCVLLSSLARFPFLEMEWNCQMQGHLKVLEVYYWYYLASYLSESDNVLSFFCLRGKIMRNSFPIMVYNCFEKNILILVLYF